MNYESPLKQGDKVVIIWTKKKGFVNIDAEFIFNVDGITTKNTPLFKSGDEEVLGEDCFWLLEKHKNQVKRYQKEVIPLQVYNSILAQKQGVYIPLKVKEAKKMAEKQMGLNSAINVFTNKYGFNPTDDSWIENCLASTKIEKNWFEYTRIKNMPVHVDDLIQDFNKTYGETITLEEALKLTIKKVRYAFGAFEVRQKGIKDTELWKKNAIDFEKRFSERDVRMEEWKKTHSRTYFVSTKKSVEFWPGNLLVRFIEKIPQVFTSPDCDFIKSGVSLEVISFDPMEKWINLDFTSDIRELVLKQKEPLQQRPYSVVIHPSVIYDCLDGVDELE
jgi:hypothetical protein